VKSALICLVLLAWALAFAACREKPVKQITGPPSAGMVCSLNDGEGGFRAGKVLAAEEEVVFVHLFAPRWSRRPTAAEALEKPGAPLAVAYSPESFAGMQPAFLTNAPVDPEELQLFETWRAGTRDKF
jgi:hypothetical protein